MLLKNISKSYFVSACKKLTNAKGKKQSSTDAYNLLSSKIKDYHDAKIQKNMELNKTWEDIFNLYDINNDDKLDKYEAKLVLATVVQKEVNNIDDSMLKDNYLKVNLENISKNNFIKACEKLNSSPSESYDIFSPRIKKYHNLTYQKETLKQSVKVLEMEEEEDIKVNKFKIDTNILYIVLFLFIPIAMILASMQSNDNN